MTINLCRISRKNHFRSPVCKNYSHFILQYRPVQAFQDFKMFFVSLRRGSEINSTWLLTRQSAREKHYSLVCYILWVFSTSKKPIGILNLKPWTEFDFTPLNRYLRPQLSFISEETLIVSSVTLPSPLEMLSNPVNLPCMWHEMLAGV